MAENQPRPQSSHIKADAASLSIRHLTTIYGATPEKFLDQVQMGRISKEELRDKHGHVLALRNIQLEIPAGSVQVVMGLSGSGKSTLLRNINRLIEPTSGEIFAGEQNIRALSPKMLQDFRRQQTAMVFQKFALFPHYTVRENTEYSLSVMGVARKKRRELALYWIDRVGLKGYADSYPNQLSGGMQQRVGLARALCRSQAPFLLMDEPFSALDPVTRNDMQEILLKLQQELRKTMVFITHDWEEARCLGDQIAILQDGEFVQQGTGEQIAQQPANAYVAKFIRNIQRSTDKEET